jgi:hypothetical protein
MQWQHCHLSIGDMMNKTDTELTQEYCETIATEVSALEALLDDEETSRQGSTPEFVRELYSVLQTMKEQADEGDDYQPSAIDWLNAFTLEIKYLGERSPGDYQGGDYPRWTTTGVKILRTFGGPNCWITASVDDDYVLIETYWGLDEARQRVLAPNVAAQLLELADD